VTWVRDRRPSIGGARLVALLPRDGLRRLQALGPHQLDLRQPGLRARQRHGRLVARGLGGERARVDREQLIALAHKLAIAEMDLLQRA
jgi:hypothetical protein